MAKNPMASDTDSPDTDSPEPQYDSQSKYESDTTKFLRELKAKRPDLEDKQREGRAMWWDKPQDLREQARLQASQVRQGAYVYQTKS